MRHTWTQLFTSWQHNPYETAVNSKQHFPGHHSHFRFSSDAQLKVNGLCPPLWLYQPRKSGTYSSPAGLSPILYIARPPGTKSGNQKMGFSRTNWSRSLDSLGRKIKLHIRWWDFYRAHAKPRKKTPVWGKNPTSGCLSRLWLLVD